MEIKIGLLDNDNNSLFQLCNFLDSWSIDANVIISTSIFKTNKELYSCTNLRFDILFMETKTDSIDGIELARFLRSHNYPGDIVYLTLHKKYVFEAYKVHALDYILKPARFSQISYCMDFVKNSLRRHHFIYKYRNTVLSIPYREIIYFTSHNQYTEIVTLHNQYRKIEPLKNIIKYIPSYFYQCHRTIIINIHYLDKLIGKEAFLTTGMSLPVSNTYLSSIQNAFSHRPHC